jgi:hypothetical protein
MGPERDFYEGRQRSKQTETGNRANARVIRQLSSAYLNSYIAKNHSSANYGFLELSATRVQGAVSKNHRFKNFKKMPSLKQIYGTTMTELTDFPRFQVFMWL